MDIIYDSKDWLVANGLWTILVLLVVKTALGILVAVQKNEFKWFYLANVLKNDGLKVATLVILTFATSQLGGQMVGDVTAVGAGALLVAELTAGVVKNVAHLLPGVANNVPSAFREPSRLRLGNSRNLPN